LAAESPPSEFRPSRLVTVAHERSLAIPLVLVGALLISVVVRTLLARRIVTPWIMVDELLYSELAKSFASDGEFTIRDAPTPIYSVAYPALISPAWLAGSIETAYAVARGINALLMTLAAVPVYLWGRRLMPSVYAAIAAVLVLLMPAMTYTGMVMTENAFFPAFVMASFAIALALERPTLARQALALVAIGIVCAVRVQGLVLLPIYGAALMLKLVLDLRLPEGPRGLRHVLGELRRYLASALALLVLGAGYLVVNILRGAPLEQGLGAYGGVVKVEYDVSNAASWVLDHFAELALSVAVIPVSALIVVLGLAVRGWPTSAAERAFVAVAATTVVLTVFEVGIFASRFAIRIEERNMFCVVPLLFLALSLWVARGLPRPLFLTAFAAFVPAALLLSLDLPSLLNIGILSDTFGLIPLLRLSQKIGGGADTAEVLMWGGGLAAGLAFALLPRRLASAALPAGVALFLVLSSYSVFGSIRDHAERTQALTGTSDPTWIDERIGADANAAYFYGGTQDLIGDAQILWQTEFWNRSVETVYRLGPPEPAPLPESVATLNQLSGRISSEPAGQLHGVRYAVAPNPLELAGTLVARQERLSVYRIQPPVRLTSLLEGVYADGWMGTDASFMKYGAPGARAGRLRVRVSRADWPLPTPPADVTIRVGTLAGQDGKPAIGTVTSSRTWTVRSRTARSFTLATPRPPFRLELHVSETFAPADYGMVDPRDLGAQVELESPS